jgi:hypothetical protein
MDPDTDRVGPGPTKVLQVTLPPAGNITYKNRALFIFKFDSFSKGKKNAFPVSNNVASMEVEEYK